MKKKFWVGKKILGLVEQNFVLVEQKNFRIGWTKKISNFDWTKKFSLGWTKILDLGEQNVRVGWTKFRLGWTKVFDFVEISWFG